MIYNLVSSLTLKLKAGLSKYLLVLLLAMVLCVAYPMKGQSGATFAANNSNSLGNSNNSSLERATKVQATHKVKVVPINWCIGPVYTFDDLDNLEKKVAIFEQYNLHPAILTMPVYDNTDTKTYQGFARVLRTLSNRGLPILIREPLINLEGTYGKNREQALYEGINNLVASHIVVSGVVIDKTYEPNSKILDLQTLLPVNLNNFYVGNDNLKDDWYDDVHREAYQAILVDLNFPDEQLKSWLDRRVDGHLVAYPWGPPQDLKSFDALIENWNTNNQLKLSYQDRFMLQEEAKIAGRNMGSAPMEKVLDISKNVQLVSIAVAGIALALLVMFFINRSINRQKFIR